MNDVLDRLEGLAAVCLNLYIHIETDEETEQVQYTVSQSLTACEFGQGKTLESAIDSFIKAIGG